MKFPKFKIARKPELILLALFLFFFFISDLAQNKFLDLGMDYKVIVFWNITMLALDVWTIFIILFHVALIGLFLYSLKIKSNNKWDIGVGIFATFGVAILVAGVVNQIHSETIHFLFMNLRSIDFYHIGVYIEMFAAFYWAFTD